MPHSPQPALQSLPGPHPLAPSHRSQNQGACWGTMPLSPPQPRNPGLLGCLPNLPLDRPSISRGTHHAVLSAQSCLTLCDPWTVVHQAPLSMGFSRPEYWSGWLCPPPEDFPTQGSNPGLPCCRQILSRLSHQKTFLNQKESESRSVMSNFLRPHGLQPASLLCSWGSSQARDQTQVFALQVDSLLHQTRPIWGCQSDCSFRLLHCIWGVRKTSHSAHIRGKGCGTSSQH